MSKERVAEYVDGRVFRNPDMEMKQQMDSKHVMWVSLQNRERGLMKKIQVYRLMMLTFCPRVDASDFDVHHKDHNRLNNFLHNLEWLDHPTNVRESGEAGCVQFGDDHYFAQYSEETIRTIRQRVKNGEKQTELAVEFGMHVDYLNAVVKMRARKKDGLLPEGQ
jgi:hypothetical protein